MLYFILQLPVAAFEVSGKYRSVELKIIKNTLETMME